MRAILLGGTIVGALDITYAFVSNGLRGISWIRVLQSVASGLLGKAAFTGGAPAAALGLALHFVNALLIASVFFAASRRVTLLTQRPVLGGLFYGVLAYLVMSRVVVPLSAAPFTIPLRVEDLFAHMFLVGLPISLSVHRYTSST